MTNEKEERSCSNCELHGKQCITTAMGGICDSWQESELSKCQHKLTMALQGLALLHNNCNADSNCYRESVISEVLKKLKEIDDD